MYKVKNNISRLAPLMMLSSYVPNGLTFNYIIRYVEITKMQERIYISGDISANKIENAYNNAFL